MLQVLTSHVTEPSEGRRKEFGHKDDQHQKKHSQLCWKPPKNNPSCLMNDLLGLRYDSSGVLNNTNNALLGNCDRPRGDAPSKGLKFMHSTQPHPPLRRTLIAPLKTDGFALLTIQPRRLVLVV